MIRIAVVTCLWHRRALAGVVLRHLARVREELSAEDIWVTLVACVSTEEDAALARPICECTNEGPNEPLGAKWGRGVLTAFHHDLHDAVVIVGSDDLVSADVFRRWVAILRANEDSGAREPLLLGLRDTYVYRPADGRMALWPGYPEGSNRHGEAIGAARCMSRQLLDALDWKPWDETLDKGLDGSMRARAATVNAREITVPMADAGPVLDVKHDPEGVGIGSWAGMTEGAVRCEAGPVLARFPAETIADLARSCDPVASAPVVWAPVAEPLCSAALILRDEAASIERCLRSIATVADEVVAVVDAATTDRTAEIVERMGGRVIRRDWTDDFSAARNAGLEQCRGRWRLIIDGDEEMIDPADLRAAMEDPANQDADGIDVAVLSTDGRSQHVQASARVLGPAVRYQYPAHNMPVGFTRRVVCSAVIQTSYEGVVEEHAARTLPMLLAMTKDPRWDGDAHAPFHLAQTYAYLQNWTEALRWADISIALDPDGPAHAAAWNVRARALIAADRRVDALRCLADALDRHGHGPRGGYADLWRLVTTIGMAGWWTSSRVPGEYAFIPQEDPTGASRIPDAIRALGLPLRIERRADA